MKRLKNLNSLKKEMAGLANKKQAAALQRFFKTGKGQYGEGDVFLGIKVPQQRKIAKKYQGLSLSDVQKLISSKIHEHRLVALLILVSQFEQSTPKEQERIYKFYLKNTSRVNNWDLVDLSAHKIVGRYLENRDKSILIKFARSSSLWERRIAVLATFHFINKNKFDWALKIARTLVDDEHDLIHKAVGWMLREIGKRDLATEEGFLKKYYKKMPRTTLRYAIERFSDRKRKFYMGK